MRTGAAEPTLVGALASFALACLAALVSAPAPALAGARGVEPLPLLHGRPLAGATHLRLVVAGIPPLLVDVDAGTVEAVSGVPTDPGLVVWVEPVRGAALAFVEHVCRSCPDRVRAYRIDRRGRA